MFFKKVRKRTHRKPAVAVLAIEVATFLAVPWVNATDAGTRVQSDNVWVVESGAVIWTQTQGQARGQRRDH